MHDGIVHHPLGGASYYFGKALIQYIHNNCDRPCITLHIGTQPNSAPHIGNIANFSTAFAIASALEKDYNRKVNVVLVYVDTAPAIGQEMIIDGVKYQRSLGYTGDFQARQPEFMKILHKLSGLSGVNFQCRTQDFWRKQPLFTSVLQDIITRNEKVGSQISPETGCLGIRSPCPHDSCGLADKRGINNVYQGNHITFQCPHHGPFTLDITDPQNQDRLEFNTPLRNLIRVTLCGKDDKSSWILVPGGDYAGFYQEQLLWRIVTEPQAVPIILYAPLILDWSGSKLSKSMYVKKGAYEYLRNAGLEYALDSEIFVSIENALEALYEETQSWIAEPYKLFRAYTLEYLHTQLLARGMKPVAE